MTKRTAVHTSSLASLSPLPLLSASPSSSTALTMPAVVAAFKSLIRKHHNHRQLDADTQESTKLPPQASQNTIKQPQHPAEQPIENHTSPSPEASTKREMVAASGGRPSKSNLPTYKGLENFKLVARMGDGAFSDVYKAIDLATGEKVAVKVVRKHELNASQAGEKYLSPQFKKKPRVTERTNILKEVQIMRSMNHLSIVKLISFSESPDYYFLILELMEGGELFHQIVKLTYFSENLARHVILQVAQGIRYLHEERGVVHRDIKPENLLFEPIPTIPSKMVIRRPYDDEKEDEGEFIPGLGGGGIGRVKIADFGLSKVVWNEETMTPCGTVGYTAPEIVKDERYSKSVDMWALGCVLYTLLCGFPPFYDESINVLTEKVARGYYTFLSPFWDHISSSAKDLIEHLLCVDPAQRYTIDEFLAHPWCGADPVPPPLPTPNSYAQTPPLDSPLLTAAHGGIESARSPGLTTLKEAFDITYAVHRMEEEGARRRAYNGRGGAGARGFLHGLNEDDEDGDGDDESLINEVRHRRGQANGGVPADTKALSARNVDVPGAVAIVNRVPEKNLWDGRAGPRDRGRRAGGSRGFELDIDNATLLGRRNKRTEINVANPLPQNIIPPGSPMRIE
ncbi:kinase-like domain-containing protein [Butyriboletus roseoflavus]|nr:kinase-like domain-containing protein [Butyriboletus roseoflavus]